MPLWWNWQTRWTQNPVVAIPCRFDPDQRHQNGAPDKAPHFGAVQRSEIFFRPRARRRNCFEVSCPLPALRRRRPCAARPAEGRLVGRPILAPCRGAKYSFDPARGDGNFFRFYQTHCFCPCRKLARIYFVKNKRRRRGGNKFRVTKKSGF